MKKQQVAINEKNKRREWPLNFLAFKIVLKQLGVF
jgi:hypothetical protein